MTEKKEFNAEEWSLVVEGPAMAALWVISAEKGGTLRESLEMGRVYRDERENHANSELLDLIVAEQPQIDQEALAGAGSIPSFAQTKIREAVSTLERIGTEVEVDDYRRFSFALADQVARAHKEGGFLGIGGKEISEDERTALTAIADTLGYEIPTELQADEGE